MASYFYFVWHLSSTISFCFLRVSLNLMRSNHLSFDLKQFDFDLSVLVTEAAFR